MANTLKIKRGTNATIPQGQLAEPLFTTDTYDLYIGKGAGGNQRIQNYIASGTSSQFLKGDGTLDSTSYQPLITAGTTSQYYRGDKTFQTLDTSVVPENGPIYFTEPRVRATVLTGLNLSGGGTIAATDSVLTAFGKVQNQISALVGGATYQGVWNANTNSPALTSSVGTKGYYYVVSVAGSTNLDGITDWKIGDWAIFNGTTWDKVDNTDAVSSVNGFTGAVNLALDNISDVSAASPTNAQLLRFNGTSSLWENWTPNYVPYTGATADVDLGFNNFDANQINGFKIAAKLDGTNSGSVILRTGTTGYSYGNDAISLISSPTSANTLTIISDVSSVNKIAQIGLGSLTATRTYTLPDATGTLALTSNIPANIITGTGTSGRVAYWNSGTTIAADDSLLFSPTSTFRINNVITAAAGGASSFNLISTINAAANNDILYGVNINPTFNNGAFTGVTQRALGVFGNVYINGTITSGAWNGSVIGSSYGGAGTVSGILKANGSGTVSAAVAGTDYVIPSALNSYLPLTGGTLTGALSGTSATFSGNVFVGGSTLYNPTFAQRFIVLDAGTTGDNTSMMQLMGSRTVNGTYGAIEFMHQAQGNRLAIRAKRSGADNSVGMDILVTNAGSTSTALDILPTGAATFSSSVTAGGSVGVGGTNTDSLLTVNGTAGTSHERFREGSTTVGFVGGANGIITGHNGKLALRAESGLILSGTGNSPDVIIASGGNVGIGTVTPDIFGRGDARNVGISVAGASDNMALQLNAGGSAGRGAQIYMGQGGTRHFTLSSNATESTLGTTSNTALRFTTNDAERMRITSGGNVLIRTTTNPYGVASLVVNHDSTYNRTYFQRGVNLIEIQPSDGTNSNQISSSYTSSGSAYRPLSLSARQNESDLYLPITGEILINTTTDSGDYKLQVNGNVYATAYFESSDIRLKDVLKNSYSENFSAIEFMWKDKRDEKKHWGYAAQDVMKYIPDAIEVNKDGMMTVNYNEAHTWKIAQLEAKIVELEAKIK